MNSIKTEIAFYNLNRYKTNHILHLLLTATTAGLWVIVWIAVTIDNKAARKRAMEVIAIEAAEDDTLWVSEGWAVSAVINIALTIPLVLIFLGIMYYK